MPDLPIPRIVPLGDSALLVRFSDRIGDEATSAVVAFARTAEDARLPGVTEIVPNLVSVLLLYDPTRITFTGLSAELRLAISRPRDDADETRSHSIAIRFGGADGPDLDAVAEALGMDSHTFIARHNGAPLRILATGFAPGFVYCGLHAEDMRLPRRNAVRDRVPPGSVLFAAGQTAITSTPIPTGWHVIGRTDFSNFDPAGTPPTLLRAGDSVIFEAMA